MDPLRHCPKCHTYARCPECMGLLRQPTQDWVKTLLVFGAVVFVVLCWIGIWLGFGYLVRVA